MGGILDVLNTGGGHISVSFDRASAVERDRARRMVLDMLRRGYAIFVEVAGELVPVRDFDPDRGLYYVTDVPAVPVTAEIPLSAGGEGPGSNRPTPPAGVDDGVPLRGDAARAPEPVAQCPRCHRPKHRGRCARRAVPMETARATAVGRSAGG